MSPRNYTSPSRRYWCRLFGSIFVGAVLAAAAQADTLEFHVPAGTIIVETKDPAIKVSLSGEELSIAGVGYANIQLKTGTHLFPSSTKGNTRRKEVLLLNKGGRVVVRVTAIRADQSKSQPKSSDTSRENYFELCG
jgi:hypothetical protein